MVWDLLVYANVNALEVVSGKLGPTYLDPFRRSHLDATARDTWIPPWSVQDYNALRDVGARPQMKRQGSVSVDAAYRAMPAHHTPTEFDAKGSSGQSVWAGMMPDAAAAPPTPVNRASKWPGWKK